MEGIAGVIVFVALIGISIASAIDKQKKTARGSGSPRPVLYEGSGLDVADDIELSDSRSIRYEEGSYNAETAGLNAETAPRRIPPTTTIDTAEVVDNEDVTSEPATNFDLRRAVIESEILNPKYL